MSVTKLHRLRREAGYRSSADFARAVGIESSVWLRCEREDMPIPAEVLARVASGLEVSLTQLEPFSEKPVALPEPSESEDLEVLAKSDVLVPEGLTLHDLAQQFMELWGEHLADVQIMDGISNNEANAAIRQMNRVVGRLIDQMMPVVGSTLTRADVELMADWYGIDAGDFEREMRCSRGFEDTLDHHDHELWDVADSIAHLARLGALTSVINDYPDFDYDRAEIGDTPGKDGKLNVFTVYHGHMRQDFTGGHASWDFEEDGTMPESYVSRENAEEKFREWSGDLQGDFDREAACRGGVPSVAMARTGYGVELRREVWERDEDGQWQIATDDPGMMESVTLDTASYTLDDHLAAIESQEREREQGYDLASACRESCLAADALAEDEKGDPDGRDDR